MPNTFEPSNPPLLLSPSPNTLIQQQSFYPVQNDSFLQVIKLSPSLKRLYVLGAVFAENGFLQRSDERTKTRIIPIQNALIRLMNVSGKSFQYNSSTTTRYGFIAQELKKEFPELVKEDDNGYLSVDPISLIPFIVESVKQLDNDLQPHLKTYDITAAILDESKKLLNELNQFQNVFTFSLGPRILTLPLAIFTTIFSAISSIAWSSLPFIWIFFIILSGGLFYSSRTSNATNTHGIKMSISFFVLLAIMCSAFTFVVGSSFRVVSIYFVSVLIIWGCGQFIGHWKVWFYSFLFISLLCIGILFGMASHQPGYTCKATVSDDFVFVNRTPWNCLSPELGFVFNNNDVIWVGLKGESLMKPFHGNSTVGVKLKCSEVVNFECGEIKL
ncbi:Peptidase S74 domain-containing protein [Entamoeba marina]